MQAQSANIQEPDLRKVCDGIIKSCENYGEAETPPPAPEACPHCGKTLYWTGLRHDGVVKVWLYLERCDCAAAVAEREKREREYQAEQKAKEIEAANRRKMLRIERLIGKSGMGARFQRRTFETYICFTAEQSARLKECKEYADNFDTYLEDGTGLFIAGSVGTGKTHLAAAIANKLLQSGIPVIFRTAIDMFLDIRRSYSGEVSESDVLNEYKTVPLLVIDDLGKEKMTEWAASTLYGIVNARYENMKPIIVTTNFTSKDLLESLGDEPTRAQAILSRLMETSVYLSMQWADYRVGGDGNA